MLPSTVPYTEEQLKDALDSLMEGRPASEGKHLFGYGDKEHKLSMLQKVTATQILDYRARLSDPSTPSQEELIERAQEFRKTHGEVLNLKAVIQGRAPSMALAAEFKRASPSKGNIATHLSAGDQAKVYADAGASIISVLTEPHWFLGSVKDMQDARLYTKKSRPAILRKEFIYNTYMIAEGAAHGCDTVLLIVSVLPTSLLKELIDFSRSLQIEPLVEVHADPELDVALQAGARVIGVNNRNLHTFQVDMERTLDIATILRGKNIEFDGRNSNVQPPYTLCTLSGMSTAVDVDKYRQAGVSMCLIGESLMKAADPARAICGLCLDPADYANHGDCSGGAYTGGTKLIKVCGITNAEDALAACRAGANLIGVIFAPRSKRVVTPEQARQVVEAVRSYGERKGRTKLDIKGASLSKKAHVLENAVRNRPIVVGVFQNQDAEFISEMVNSCGLGLVQLHGKEGMEAASPKYCGGVPAIRVVDIPADESGKVDSKVAAKQIVDSLTDDPLAILLDTSVKGGGGGTGKTFDWSICTEVQSMGIPVIIAGGLQPENVQDAVEKIGPWGIDVSSGVEESPGKKDVKKVQQFVRNARQAATESRKAF